MIKKIIFIIICLLGSLYNYNKIQTIKQTNIDLLAEELKWQSRLEIETEFYYSEKIDGMIEDANLSNIMYSGYNEFNEERHIEWIESQPNLDDCLLYIEIHLPHNYRFYWDELPDKKGYNTTNKNELMNFHNHLYCLFAYDSSFGFPGGIGDDVWDFEGVLKLAQRYDSRTLVNCTYSERFGIRAEVRKYNTFEFEDGRVTYDWDSVLLRTEADDRVYAYSKDGSYGTGKFVVYYYGKMEQGK